MTKFNVTSSGERPVDTSLKSPTYDYSALGAAFGSLINAGTQVVADRQKAAANVDPVNPVAVASDIVRQSKDEHLAGLQEIASTGAEELADANKLYESLSADGDFSSEDEKKYKFEVGVSLRAIESLSPVRRQVAFRKLANTVLASREYQTGSNDTVKEINKLLGINLHQSAMAEVYSDPVAQDVAARFGENASPEHYAAVQAEHRQRAEWEYKAKEIDTRMKVGQYAASEFLSDVSDVASVKFRPVLMQMQQEREQQGFVSEDALQAFRQTVAGTKEALRKELADNIKKSGGIQDAGQYYAAIDSAMAPIDEITEHFERDPSFGATLDRFFKIQAAGAQAGTDVNLSQLMDVQRIGGEQALNLMMRTNQDPKALAKIFSGTVDPALAGNQAEIVAQANKVFTAMLKGVNIPGYEKFQATLRKMYANTPGVKDPEVLDSTLKDLEATSMETFPGTAIKMAAAVRNMNNAGMQDKYAGMVRSKTDLFVSSLLEQHAKIEVGADGKWLVTRERDVLQETPGYGGSMLRGTSYERSKIAEEDKVLSDRMNDYERAFLLARGSTRDEFRRDMQQLVEMQDKPSTASRRTARVVADENAAGMDDTLRQARQAVAEGRDPELVKRKLLELKRADGAAYTEADWSRISGPK